MLKIISGHIFVMLKSLDILIFQGSIPIFPWLKVDQMIQNGSAPSPGSG